MKNTSLKILPKIDSWAMNEVYFSAFISVFSDWFSHLIMFKLIHGGPSGSLQVWAAGHYHIILTHY